MLSLTRFQYNFIVNWRFGILALLFCLFFVRLGVWQLDRADEKEQMLAAQHRFAKQAPSAWSNRSPLPLQYQSIRVSGNFLKVTLLLDNQHYQHQFGYDVITPLLLENGHVVLVDRGWVLGDANRENMPAITTPSAKLEVLGSAYYPSEKNWFLGNIFDRKQPNLAVIEFIDTHMLSQFLHKSVYPFIIRMRPEASSGFVREWSVVAMSPSRHLAYAVQWFALALLVVILFIVLSVKKKI